MPLKRHGPPSKRPDRDKTKPTTKTLPGLPPRKPKIIGLFGLSGTGTSFLLEELREEMKEDGFAFNDGNEALTAICPGGLMAYNALGAVKRARYRDVTITAFENECVRKDVIGVVVRYLAFWNEDSECFSVTPVADLKAHTHILYLELPFAHFPQYWETFTKVRRRTQLSSIGTVGRKARYAICVASVERRTLPLRY